MPDILVLTDCVLVLDGFTVTDKASKIELPVEVDELDVTPFGGVWKRRTGGLLDAKLSAAFFNDYTAGGLDEKMWAWLLGRVPITFAVQPTTAAISPANPRWTGMVLPKGYSPINGDVGSVNKFDISWSTSGDVGRVVS